MKTTTIRRHYILSLNVNAQICITGSLNDQGRIASEEVWKVIRLTVAKFHVENESISFEQSACTLMRLIIEATLGIAKDLSFGVILEGEIESVYVGTTS